MEEIISAMSEHQIMTVVVLLAILLITFYIVKSVVKIGIILMIVVVVIGGYLYFKNPENRPESLRDAFNKAKTSASEIVKKGESAYQKSRGLAEKGTDTRKKSGEIVKGGRDMLAKGIEKGRDIIEKGKDKAEDIIKLLKKESDDK